MDANEWERLLLEADAQNIGEAWIEQGLPPEAAPFVVENCLRLPEIIADLRRGFGWSDTMIARAMVNPPAFAEEVLPGIIAKLEAGG